MLSNKKSFLNNEQGQDLIEYILLIAFVAIASAAIFYQSGGAFDKIWGSAKTTQSSAAKAATGGTTTTAPAK